MQSGQMTSFINKIKIITKNVQACDDISQISDDPVFFCQQLSDAIEILVEEKKLEGIVYCLDLMHKIYPLMGEKSVSYMGVILPSLILCLSLDDIEDLVLAFLNELQHDILLSELLKSVLEDIVHKGEDPKLIQKIQDYLEDTYFIKQSTLPKENQNDIEGNYNENLIDENHSVPYNKFEIVKMIISLGNDDDNNNMNPQNNTKSNQINDVNNTNLHYEIPFTSSIIPNTNNHNGNSNNHNGNSNKLSDHIDENTISSNENNNTYPHEMKFNNLDELIKEDIPIDDNNNLIDDIKSLSSNSSEPALYEHNRNITYHKRIRSANRSYSISPRIISPRQQMNTSFLPNYLMKRWQSYSSIEDLNYCIEAISDRFIALDPVTKQDIHIDFEVILKQLIENLSLNIPSVQCNVLQLLDKFVLEYPDDFIPYFKIMFNRIQEILHEKDETFIIVHVPSYSLLQSLVSRLPPNITLDSLVIVLKEIIDTLITKDIVNYLQLISLCLLSPSADPTDSHVSSLTTMSVSLLRVAEVDNNFNMNLSQSTLSVQREKDVVTYMHDAAYDVLTALFLLVDASNHSPSAEILEEYQITFINNTRTLKIEERQEIYSRSSSLRFPSLLVDYNTSTQLKYLLSLLAMKKPAITKKVSILTKQFLSYQDIDSKVTLGINPINVDQSESIMIENISHSTTNESDSSNGIQVWGGSDSSSGSPWLFHVDKIVADKSKLSSLKGKKLKKLSSLPQLMDKINDGFDGNSGLGTGNILNVPKTSISLGPIQSDASLGIMGLQSVKNHYCNLSSPSFSPQTPIEVGMYSDNGTRYQQLRRSTHNRGGGVVYKMTHEIDSELDNITELDNGWLGVQNPPLIESEQNTQLEQLDVAPSDIVKKKTLLLRRKQKEPIHNADPIIESTYITSESDKLPAIIHKVSDDAIAEPKKVIRKVSRRIPLAPPKTNIRCPSSLAVDDNSTNGKISLKSTLTGGTEEFEYITSDQLQPLDDPKNELPNILSDLATQEWPEIFHTITLVRRLGLYHKRVIKETLSLPSFIKGLLKTLHDLRSAVIKNALLALGDFYTGLGKDMDGEVLNTVPIMFKKLVDSSRFISESAESAIQKMVGYASVKYSLKALLITADYRHANIRGKASLYLLRLIQIRSRDLMNNKDMQLLLPKLSKLITDQSPEARLTSKEAIRMIYKLQLASRDEMEKYISIDQLNKCINSIGEPSLQLPSSLVSLTPSGPYSFGDIKISVGGIPKPVSPRSSNSISSNKNNNILKKNNKISDGQNNGYSEKKKSGKGLQNDIHDVGVGVGIGSVEGSSYPKGINITPVQVSADGIKDNVVKRLSQQHASAAIDIPSFIEMKMVMSAKSWRERKEALHTMTEYVCLNMIGLEALGKLEDVIEAFMIRIEDGTAEVGIAAVNCLRRIDSTNSSVLKNMLVTVLPYLLSASLTTNKEVSLIVNDFLWEILSKCQPDVVITNLLSICTNSRDRLKVAAFRIMETYTIKNIKNPQTIIKRKLFPIICQSICANGTKPDVRNAVIKVLKSFQNFVSEDISSWPDSSTEKEEINRILSSAE